MLNSSILDVVIGLAYVYLILSLIVSAANEMFTSVLRWRARTLKAGITELLDAELAGRFYAHPLIAKLGAPRRDPSYLPARTFSLALLDVAVPA